MHRDNLRIALTQPNVHRDQVKLQRAMAAERLRVQGRRWRRPGPHRISATPSIYYRTILTPSRSNFGEWVLTSGRTVIRVRTDQAMSHSRKSWRRVEPVHGPDYKGDDPGGAERTEISSGETSSFKLHCAGWVWGGASDPGDPDYLRVSLIRMRDEVVKPLVAKGQYNRGLSNDHVAESSGRRTCARVRRL